MQELIDVLNDQEGVRINEDEIIELDLDKWELENDYYPKFVNTVITGENAVLVIEKDVRTGNTRVSLTIGDQEDYYSTLVTHAIIQVMYGKIYLVLGDEV